MYDNKKIECYNIFSKMNSDDDISDAGNNIKILGRWHTVGGGSGTCICESTNIESIFSWMFNWNQMCDILVEPVIDDMTFRNILKKKIKQDESVSNISTSSSIRINDCCNIT